MAIAVGVEVALGELHERRLQRPQLAELVKQLLKFALFLLLFASPSSSPRLLWVNASSAANISSVDTVLLRRVSMVQFDGDPS